MLKCNMNTLNIAYDDELFRSYLVISSLESIETVNGFRKLLTLVTSVFNFTNFSMKKV